MYIPLSIVLVKYSIILHREGGYRVGVAAARAVWRFLGICRRAWRVVRVKGHGHPMTSGP